MGAALNFNGGGLAVTNKLLEAPPYQLDLSEPFPDLVGHGVALVLVRRQGQPLGVLKLELSDTPVAGDKLASYLEAGFPELALSPQDLEISNTPAAEPAPKSLSATIVVTAIKPTDDLLRVLSGCSEQTVKPVEIIVVDNRPTTSGLLEFLQDHAPCDYMYVAEAQQGLSAARNAGAAHATGDVVVFTDDDVVLDPRWLQQLLEGFDHDDIACVTGLILPLDLTAPAQQLLEEFGGFSKGFEKKRFNLTDAVDSHPLYPFIPGRFGSGANTAIRADFLRAMGGFDQALGTGTPARGGEDLDLYLEVLARGGVINYQPSAVLWHNHRQGMDDLTHQIFNYGLGLGAMLSKRIATRPRERKEMLRRGPAALRYLLSSSSDKNRAKTHEYPRRLNLTEYCGLAVGPFAYWRSRRRLAKLTSQTSNSVPTRDIVPRQDGTRG